MLTRAPSTPETKGPPISQGNVVASSLGTVDIEPGAESIVKPIFVIVSESNTSSPRKRRATSLLKNWQHQEELWLETYLR